MYIQMYMYIAHVYSIHSLLFFCFLCSFFVFSHLAVCLFVIFYSVLLCVVSPCYHVMCSRSSMLHEDCSNMLIAFQLAICYRIAMYMLWHSSCL